MVKAAARVLWTFRCLRFQVETILLSMNGNAFRGFEDYGSSAHKSDLNEGATIGDRVY